jgi:hypothetical protein
MIFSPRKEKKSRFEEYWIKFREKVSTGQFYLENYHTPGVLPPYFLPLSFFPHFMQNLFSIAKTKNLPDLL